MLRLQRQQMIQENKKNIGISLEEPEGDYQRNSIFPINHPTGDKNEEKKKYGRFYYKLLETIGAEPLSTQALNKSLQEHFGVEMKVDPVTHYPAQKTITIEGVTCNIVSDSHRPGFFLKVPRKKTKVPRKKTKNNNVRKIG